MDSTFTYGSPDFLNTENDGYWNQDTSTYLWDSPRPDDTLQDFSLEDTNLEYTAGASQLADITTNVSSQDYTSGGMPQTTNPSALLIQPQHGINTAAPSVASEDSSHSSTSEHSGRIKRETSSTSSPAASGGNSTTGGVCLDPSAMSIKLESGFGDGEHSFNFEESTLPNVGAGIDSLSLSNAGTTTHSPDFSFNATSPDPMSMGMFGGQGVEYMPHNMGGLRSMHSAGASPQMTMQPSKMFVIGEANENSPSAMNMMNGMEDTSNSFFNTQTPLGMGGDGFAGALPPDASLRRGNYSNPATMAFNNPSSTTLNAGHPTHKVEGAQPPTAWPCKLTVESIPDKSRVETQIPIRLTLTNAPKNITKLHLPPYTISKPKFQAKPPFVKSEDILELSCMLVCASAMQKEGLRDIAFNRAAAEDPDVEVEEKKESTPPGQMDENDPMKPLNGGPVTICQGCIVRERKRAARKKTKKADEEEEWAKDEAKRVIVFNCPEVRDWCVPGTKETSVKEHDGPIDQCFVTAPMRVACYCRHQSEKVGFQVIFTIRTSTGKIIAQAMSESIMITDDHKQPTSGNVAQMPFTSNPMSSTGMFTPTTPFGVYPTFAQDMPFRTSWSTNDLRTLNQYAPQRRPPTFSRQNSGSYASTQVSTAASTATATPRNLSRPASPTSPSGHSTKKRRSGIGPSQHKMPAGLAMTRMEDITSTPISGTPITSAPPSNFSFNSPAAFSANISQQFGPAMPTPDPYRSGPTTPMPNVSLSNTAGVFGANTTDPYEFWSAPTSQHASRAPSPRLSRQNSFTPAAAQAATHTPAAAAFALSSLPQGLNLQRPPTIQRLIPPGGPRSGGDEVTVLGSGFFQGLDVMFGDKLATNTTFWGDTTIVCRAPPNSQGGVVPVVFKHQHHTAPPEMLQLQAIMPTRINGYHYLDEPGPAPGAGGGMGMGMVGMAGTQQQQQQQQQQAQMQMQALAMGFAAQQQQQAQQQGRDLSQMSQEELARAFMANQAAMAGYAGVGRGVAGPRRMGGVRTHSSKTVNVAANANGNGGGGGSANVSSGGGAGASAGQVS